MQDFICNLYGCPALSSDDFEVELLRVNPASSVRRVLSNLCDGLRRSPVSPPLRPGADLRDEEVLHVASRRSEMTAGDFLEGRSSHAEAVVL